MFHRILLHLRIAAHYCAQALKMNMEYRLDFLVECLAALAMQYTKLLTIDLMLTKFNDMSDGVRVWNKYEVFFIFGFSLLPMGLFTAFALNFYQFSDKYLVGGELDRLLMRPLSSLFQLIMEGVAFDFISDVGLGIAVMIYAWPHLGTEWTLPVALRMAVAILGAWGVLTGIFLTLISLSFWSQDRLSILPPVYNLMNFAQYPISIYRPFVRILLTWIIPFAFAAFYPASAFMQKTDAFRTFSTWSPVAGIACMAVGIITWSRGMRQYSGAGT